jgi:membrane associated rhomboid family serine protease
MHAGWIHLFSNMILFLIFGAAFESIGGSFALVLVYLLGGICGGLGFLWMSPQSIAPMIGASGSLSAVMAAYAIAERKKRISYFYFLSPIPGYYGLIYLPTLLIFPLCFVADVANYLGTPVELGSGVAYTAHIGGMIFGVVAGLVVRAYFEMVVSGRRANN